VSKEGVGGDERRKYHVTKDFLSYSLCNYLYLYFNPESEFTLHGRNITFTELEAFVSQGRITFWLTDADVGGC